MTNEKYGLISKTLVHSYSKEIHEALGRYQYQLFSLAEDEMPDFINARDFRGLNVTIPYKKDVIPLCDEVTDLARGIGAVNTLFWKNASGAGASESISQEDKILVGHNTDYEGFLYAASRAGIDFEGKGVLILGTGGTSLMARRAAADQNAAKIYIASRHPETDPPSGSELQNAGILSTVSYDQLPEIAASIDVIYNPFKTALLLEAEKLGLKYTNGLPMLVAQATAAAGYFLGTPGAFQKENQRIIKAMKQRMGNIVLIGMPGTGKSLIGKFLAELTGKTLQDTDAKIEEEAKMTIPEIFEKEGEAGFRDRESAICKTRQRTKPDHRHWRRAILRPENVDALRQNGTLVHITRSIDKLPTRGRPLSKISKH